MVIFWIAKLITALFVLDTRLITALYCCISGHSDKPNIVKYHPTASGVLACSALDLTVKIWDVNKAKALITLNGHTEQVGNVFAVFSPSVNLLEF